MSPLVSAAELAVWIESGDAPWVIVDCRFALTDPSWGLRVYAEGHLPGAFYLHLEEALSGSVVPGVTGRHPLPTKEELAPRLGQLGVAEGVRVIAYDEGPGAFASRLWWLCRSLGHEEVFVLDGGLARWVSEGRKLEREVPAPTPRQFSPRESELAFTVSADELVSSYLGRADKRVFDARSLDRFRGENETIDPIAGHIQGAQSLPFLDNLRDGVFKSRDELHARFTEALGGVRPEDAVVYCGSGVTACHNLLAAEQAGLSGMRLYPGSWSEWITDPSRPRSLSP